MLSMVSHRFFCLHQMFLGYLFFACKVLQIGHTCTHILKHVSLGLGCASKTWSPPLSSPWFLLGGRPAGVVCVANRAEAEGCDQGTSLLKGSCNFHSRVLLKLVLRSALSEDPLPLLLSPSLDSPTSLSLCSCSQTAHCTFQTSSFTTSCTFVIFTGRGWRSVDLFVCMCDRWSFKSLVLNKQKSFGCLRILIVVYMVSIFFLHIIHGWASLLYTISKIFTSWEKKQWILSTWLSVMLQWSDSLK